MIVTHLKNIQIKLEEATGGAVAVELRMRLIAELSLPVRKKLIELVTIDHQKQMEKNPRAKKESDKYWACRLYFLDNAIDVVFGESLNANDRQKLIEFRSYRNQLLHCNFVKLMRELAITPTGRQILNTAGKRNELSEGDIKESILSVVRNRGLDRISALAREANNILDTLIYKIPGS